MELKREWAYVFAFVFLILSILAYRYFSVSNYASPGEGEVAVQIGIPEGGLSTQSAIPLEECRFGSIQKM